MRVQVYEILRLSCASVSFRLMMAEITHVRVLRLTRLLELYTKRNLSYVCNASTVRTHDY